MLVQPRFEGDESSKKHHGGSQDSFMTGSQASIPIESPLSLSSSLSSREHLNINSRLKHDQSSRQSNSQSSCNKSPSVGGDVLLSSSLSDARTRSAHVICSSRQGEHLIPRVKEVPDPGRVTSPNARVAAARSTSLSEEATSLV